MHSSVNLRSIGAVELSMMVIMGFLLLLRLAAIIAIAHNNEFYVIYIEILSKLGIRFMVK